MAFVADIIRRFRIRSMLVAVMALVVQANGAPAHAFAATDDCPHEAQLSVSMNLGSDVTAVRQGGVFLVSKAPCKSAPCRSACCDVACSLAVLPSPATLDVPIPTLGTRPTCVFEGAEGIEVDGPSPASESVAVRLSRSLGTAPAIRTPRPSAFGPRFHSDLRASWRWTAVRRPGLTRLLRVVLNGPTWSDRRQRATKRTPMKTCLKIAVVLAALAAPALALAEDMKMTMGASGGTPADKAFASSMQTMMKNMAVKPTGQTDKDFVRMMMPHHQGAIDMAKVELQYGTDPMLRKMAGDIVAAQEQEIGEMRAWLAKNPK